MKKKILSVAMLICAVMLLCMQSTVFTFAGEADASLGIPSGVTAVNKENSVVISWQTVDNAMGYKIYRGDGINEPVLLDYINTASKISFADKTAQSGNLYVYYVRAYNAHTESDLSNGVKHIYLSAPAIAAVSNGYGGINIKWCKSVGAQSYTVYRKNGEKEKPVFTVGAESKIEYLDKNVTDGQKYSYRVEAKKDGFVCSSQYKESSVYVSAPVIKGVQNGNGFITISWNKTKTVDVYKIYKKIGDGKWKGLKTVKNNVSSFKDTAVLNGIKYSYRVLAQDGENKSGYISAGTSVFYVDVPKNITLINNYYNGIYVKWTEVPNTKIYRVYRKDTENKSWRLIGQTKNASYQDRNLVGGMKYTYTVRADGKNGGRSAYLSGKQLICLNKPSKVNLTSTTNGVALSWNKVTSATGYRVYRKLQGESKFKLIKNLKGNSKTSFTDENVISGYTYIYTVKGVRGSVAGGYDKNGYSIQYIAAPKLRTNHSPEGVVLKWNKSAVGTGYEIHRKVYGDKYYKKYAVINNSDVTSFTDKTPVYGKFNYYRIKVIYDKDLKSASSRIFGIDPNKKMVALTYDDGPYTQVTNRILSTLKKNNSRATFFVVGSRVNTYKDCIIQADKQGCEIGNHSYNHTILTSVGSAKIKSEINSTNNAIVKLIGKAPEIVRTPGGATNSLVRSAVGAPIISWSIDTLDWKTGSSSAVVSTIKSNVRDGSIVLMHDLYGCTATATEQIVPWLIKNGYQIVTVSEMMAVKGINMSDGTVYYSAN